MISIDWVFPFMASSFCEYNQFNGIEHKIQYNPKINGYSIGEIFLSWRRQTEFLCSFFRSFLHENDIFYIILMDLMLNRFYTIQILGRITKPLTSLSFLWHTIWVSFPEIFTDITSLEHFILINPNFLQIESSIVCTKEKWILKCLHISTMWLPYFLYLI